MTRYQVSDCEIGDVLPASLECCKGFDLIGNGLTPVRVHIAPPLRDPWTMADGASFEEPLDIRTFTFEPVVNRRMARPTGDTTYAYSANMYITEVIGWRRTA